MNEDRMRDWIIEHLQPSAAQMSRDTQFQGFAKLLAEELKAHGLLDIGNAFKPLLDIPVDLDYEKVKQIIARWAYDLVEHAMREIELADLECCEHREDLVQEIPDMT
jgi:hypothetical protein